MPRKVLAMGIHQQVRIHRDHHSSAGGRSYARLLGRSAGTPGARPVPRTVTSFSLNGRRFFFLSSNAFRKPSSTSARTVVFSRAATFFASSSRASAISMVVFIWVTILRLMAPRNRPAEGTLTSATAFADPLEALFRVPEDARDVPAVGEEHQGEQRGRQHRVLALARGDER